MRSTATLAAARAYPVPSALFQLLKPVTWFPPMWAFACGIISSGASLAERWPFAVAGVMLAGPLVCGTSQAVNDWFDRHVDAIGADHAQRRERRPLEHSQTEEIAVEPERPIDVGHVE